MNFNPEEKGEATGQWHIACLVLVKPLVQCLKNIFSICWMIGFPCNIET